MLKVRSAPTADDMGSEMFTMNGFVEFSPCWRGFLGLKGPQKSLWHVLALAMKIEWITFN
jgi:hypothetical protein